MAMNGNSNRNPATGKVRLRLKAYLHTGTGQDTCEPGLRPMGEGLRFPR